MAWASGKSIGWFVGLIVVAAAAVVGVVRQRAQTPPLPVLGTLPAFSLTSQDAQPFGSQELTGQVWVANFIFTRCPTVCPPLTKKMVGLQEAGRGVEGLRLVTFSVDPDFDTPEVLRAYMQKHSADASRWTFLTGKEDALKATVVDGLKIAMGREGPADDLNAIFHGTHFVLVDERLQIRGYYETSDAERLDALVRDMKALAQERGG